MLAKEKIKYNSNMTPETREQYVRVKNQLNKDMSDQRETLGRIHERRYGKW